MVIELIEASGAHVIGAHEVVPGLLADTGPLGAHAPTDEDRRDIEAGNRRSQRAGCSRCRPGRRCSRRQGRWRWRGGRDGRHVGREWPASGKTDGSQFVVAASSSSSASRNRTSGRDLPSIGPSTVAGAHAAGLAASPSRQGARWFLTARVSSKKPTGAGCSFSVSSAIAAGTGDDGQSLQAGGYRRRSFRRPARRRPGAGVA